ncbi:MAG: DNA-binding protein [bacterium]|nr:DNA-binding protein [bacterium]
MKAIDDQVRNSLLLDFYGNLLTEKQKKTADFYFNCDLNLSEIAKKTKVTRQAVYISLKNIVKDLEKYESSLKLYHNKFSKVNAKRKKNV